MIQSRPGNEFSGPFYGLGGDSIDQGLMYSRKRPLALAEVDNNPLKGYYLCIQSN